MRGAKARSTKQKAQLQRAEALTVGKGANKKQPKANFAGLEQGAGRAGKTILDFEEVGIDIGARTSIGSLTLNIGGGRPPRDHRSQRGR